MVYKCLHGMAPIYLSELCMPVTQTEGRRQVCSAAWGQPVVPWSKLSTYGKRAFACAGPSTWNSFSDWLKDTSLSFGAFKTSLKTCLFSEWKWLLSLYSENNFFSYFHCGRLATSDGMISLARRRSRLRTRRPTRWLFPFFQNSFFQNIILGFRQAKLCLRV